MPYEITAGMVLEAIQEGAREATLEMLKNVDFSTAAGQAQAKAVLEAIQLMLDSGDAKVTLTGTTVDMATETTLAQSVDKLNSILSRLEGKFDTAIFDSQGNPISTNNRLPVDVGGQIQADVDLGDVTVDIGELQQGARGPNAEPWEVQLSGSNVSFEFADVSLEPGIWTVIGNFPEAGHSAFRIAGHHTTALTAFSFRWSTTRTAGTYGASTYIIREDLIEIERITPGRSFRSKDDIRLFGPSEWRLEARNDGDTMGSFNSLEVRLIP